MPPRRRSLAAAWVLIPLAAWVSSPAVSLAARSGADAAPAASNPPSVPRGLVVVLRPPELTETMRVVLARITGELAAASFQVRTDALDPQKDPTQQIQSVAQEADAVAAFALGGSRDSLTIWIFERLGRRTTIQRVPVRPGGFAQDAKVSALKAVELIRASLSDLWPAPAPRPAVAAPPAPPSPTSAASPPPPSPPTQPAGPPTPPSPPIPPGTPVPPTVPSPLSPPAAAAPESPTSPPPFPPPPKEEPPAATVIESPSPRPAPSEPTDTTWPPSPGLAVGLGVAALWDLRATPQWMGSLHVEGRFNARLAVQARVAGLGSSLTIPAGDSSASIERERGSLGGSWSFWSGARAYVALVAAFGAERVRGSGTTVGSRPVYSASALMPIGLIGLSATARLARHWSVAARIEGEWAWSRVELRIGDWRTVPLARPGTLSEISIQAVF